MREWAVKVECRTRMEKVGVKILCYGQSRCKDVRVLYENQPNDPDAMSKRNVINGMKVKNV